MKKIFLVLTLIAISSIVVFSQDDYKKGEFFVGFSRNQVDSGIEGGEIPGDPISESEGFNGFEASGVYNVSRYVGIKGDVSGAFRSDNFGLSIPEDPISFDVDRAVYNILGGVQLKDNSSNARVKPFAHALVGVGINRVKINNCSGSPCSSFDPTTESESGLAGAFGGGLDIKISKRIDLRVIQVDYNPIRLDGATQNNIRLGVGIVFK